MALTRKMLRAMSIDDEKIDQIIEAHGETVDALKAERDRYKADADQLPTVQAELDDLKKKSTDDGYKEKYDALTADFDNYKAEQEAKDTARAKDTALRAAFKAAGVPEKYHDKIAKTYDMSALELDESGALKDADQFAENVRADWADFVPTVKEGGSNIENPPENNPNSDPFLEGMDMGY